MPQVEISGLSVYPIKSCRPLRPDSWRVGARGLEGDRRWLIVDAHNRFMTRREVPEMAKIALKFEESGVVLHKEGQEDLSAPRVPQGVSARVRIWGTITTGRIVSDEANAWVSEALGRPCRLVYMPDSARRRVNPKYNAGKDVVGFADAYPILVASEASVQDLNSRLDSKLTVDRFRANIILRGCAPFEEDTWKRIRIGEVVLRAARPCARCLVTTQDPETGASLGQEPLRTLGKYRKYDGGGVIFGMYYVPESLGRIAVGQEICAEA